MPQKARVNLLKLRDQRLSLFPTAVITRTLSAVEKCSGAGLRRGDWIHMAQKQYSQMEVLLVEAAPHNFLGVWGQWVCGIVEFLLIKKNRDQGQSG